MESIIKWLNANGGAISAIAILAVVPLTILANVLSAKYLNWQAKKSKTRATKRIAQLEKKLETHELLFKNHFEFLKYVAQELKVFIGLFTIISGVVTVWILFSTGPIFTDSDRQNGRIFAVFIVVVLALYANRKRGLLETVRALSNFPEYKNKVTKQIEELRQTLSK